MADWMQHLCQAVSKGVSSSALHDPPAPFAAAAVPADPHIPSYPHVIPQGVAPSPCIPCCLVVTADRLFTCHEDCQTSFFRSLGTAKLADISAVSADPGREYCVLVSQVWSGW